LDVDAVRLSRLTTVLTIAVVGMGAGHLLFPYAPGATLARTLAFWAAIVGVGVLRGWRDAAVREEHRTRARWRCVFTTLASVAAAIASYWVVHGVPRGL
jgi:hypothetical protein